MGVADKSEGLTNAPGVMQRAFGRLRAPTGALASSTGIGGAVGYAAGGPAGAAVGGTLGATVAPFLQEAAASPGAWMRGARRLNPTPVGRTAPLSLVLGGATQSRQTRDEFGRLTSEEEE